MQRSYRWRAKRLFGLSSVEDAFTGTVTVIQRFDSALRLNVHLHTLALDGVYMKSDDGGLRFLRLPRPSEDEVYDVAFRMAKKAVAILEKKGRSVDGASNDEAESEIEPALLSCYDIAGRAPKTRIVDGPRLGKGECAVVVEGFNVFAGDGIDGRDRAYRADVPIFGEALSIAPSIPNAVMPGAMPMRCTFLVWRTAIWANETTLASLNLRSVRPMSRPRSTYRSPLRAR